MLRWLDRLADEGHSGERIATLYHLGFVGLYVGAILFHLFCAKRHWRSAWEKGGENGWFV